MATTSHVRAFREAVAAKLANVAPTVSEERGRAEHGRPPRYGWKTIGAEGDTAKRPKVNGGASPTSGVDLVSFEVEVWGPTEDTAWLMRGALFTALRDVTDASFKVGATSVAPEPVNDDGYVLLVVFSVSLASPEIVIPILPVDPNDFDLSPLAIEEVEIETVDIDDTEAAPGDGMLHLPEGK